MNRERRISISCTAAAPTLKYASATPPP
jgi:hypothetical protein